LKFVKPIIFIIYPLRSYAEDKDTCPNPEAGKLRSKSDQCRELVISLIGLKKCLDPRATSLQKALYSSRPCCLVAGLTAGCIAENSSAGSKLHMAEIKLNVGMMAAVCSLCAVEAAVDSPAYENVMAATVCAGFGLYLGYENVKTAISKTKDPVKGRLRNVREGIRAN